MGRQTSQTLPGPVPTTIIVIPVDMKDLKQIAFGDFGVGGHIADSQGGRHLGEILKKEEIC